MQRPREIREAVELFRLFEASNNHEERAEHLADAIEILDEYQRLNPDSTHDPYVRNLKLSHTRRLLTDLANAGHLEVMEWLNYLVPVLTRLRRETDAVLQQHPELREPFERFKESHAEELRRAARQLGYVQTD